MKKLLLLAGLAIFLSACSKGLDGTYSDKNGMMEYKFEPNGTVYMGTLGMQTELEYEVDGEELKILFPNGAGNQIMTINKDGSISGPLGIKLTPQK